jgi:ATP-dependent DNA helicase DinG
VTLPSPAEFGLPVQFDRWRANQPEAVESVLSTTARYTGLVAPTGFGKSVVAEVIAKFEGGRSAYVVATKALQEQVSGEMPHRFDIRGKGNYQCSALEDNGLSGYSARCDKAEHLCESCALKERGCSYFDAWRRAKREVAVLPNYAYWLAINKHNEEGIGKFDFLICDEAHNLPEQISSAMRIELKNELVEKHTRRAIPSAQPAAKWSDWARGHAAALRVKLDALLLASRSSARPAPELRELKYLVASLDELSAIDDQWIEERQTNRGQLAVSFEPIWPAPYLGALVRDVPRVLLMSATIRRKTLDLLGVPLDQSAFFEFPSSFPVAHRPVVHVKTVQMRAAMTEDQRREQVRRIDQIIDRRTDRKGLVHTHSFDRARFIYEHSRHRSLMILHQRGEQIAPLIEEHANAASESGKLLLSPSIDEGYNFPGDRARYQIIAKVPFLDRRNPIAKARCDNDPDYDMYEAMKGIIQMCGRPVRSETDWAETFVLDDMFAWVYPKCVKLGFVPQWFQPAVRINQVIPTAPRMIAA